jgi:hypothetical protein
MKLKLLGLQIGPYEKEEVINQGLSEKFLADSKQMK